MLLQELVGSWNQKRGCTECGPGELTPARTALRKDGREKCPSLRLYPLMLIGLTQRGSRGRANPRDGSSGGSLPGHTQLEKEEGPKDGSFDCRADDTDCPSPSGLGPLPVKLDFPVTLSSDASSPL